MDRKFFSIIILLFLVLKNPLFSQPFLGDLNQLKKTGKKSENNKNPLYLSDPGINDWPKESIWIEKKVMWTSGNQNVAKLNRKAANSMLNKDYLYAQKILIMGKKKAPQFLPFRYNLGITYYRLREYEKSYLEFLYCSRLLKNWSKIFVLMGNALSKMAKLDDAQETYRKALEINPRDLETIIALGNHFFQTQMYHSANRYYEMALKIDSDHADGLLGKSKILFMANKFYDAVLELKKIDLKKYQGYDKSYHFYYGESLYKLKRYGDSAAQYKILLDFPKDPFFLTNAISFIKFKLELANKFAEAEELWQR